MSTRNKPILILVLAFPIITLILLIIFVDNFWKNSGGYPWDIKTINDFLETPIPAGAENIEYEGRRGRGDGLTLSFEASREIMSAFTASLCDGVLHQGYNPFDAIDAAIPAENAYLIEMAVYLPVHYYSYSPDTPQTLFGNRCYDPARGQIQLIVDQANPERDALKLEILFNCYKCRVPQD